MLSPDRTPLRVLTARRTRHVQRMREVVSRSSDSARLTDPDTSMIEILLTLTHCSTFRVSRTDTGYITQSVRVSVRETSQFTTYGIAVL